jgi:hypothetical protein
MRVHERRLPHLAGIRTRRMPAKPGAFQSLRDTDRGAPAPTADRPYAARCPDHGTAGDRRGTSERFALKLVEPGDDGESG